MKLLVVSHKPCWRGADGRVETDGGFPLQMRALAELFDETTLAVPVSESARAGGTALEGVKVLPLTSPRGRGPVRKLAFPLWMVRNFGRLAGAVRAADAIHAPVPGDVGTIGMLFASVAKKPLFVRYCGNWLVQKTVAERFWRWSMERLAGGRNVMLATGGDREPPSPRNRAIDWIFATSLTREDLDAGARSSFGGRPPRLVTVCRQEPGKGTGRVLEALPELRRRFPGLGYDVVGGGTLLEGLRRRAAELDLEAAVGFHGMVDQARVRTILRGADLFCLPSRSEGFPKAVLEAMAAGVPVVTSAVSVLPRLLAGGGGVLLADREPATIVEAVAGCLEPARYRAMSERARETAAHYSLDRWRDQIGGRLEAAWGPLRNHG